MTVHLGDFIHVASTIANKQGSVIVLELSDADEALSVSEMLARETGRGVTVLNAHLTVVGTIPAASIQ